MALLSLTRSDFLSSNLGVIAEHSWVPAFSSGASLSPRAMGFFWEVVLEGWAWSYFMGKETEVESSYRHHHKQRPRARLREVYSKEENKVSVIII